MKILLKYTLPEDNKTIFSSEYKLHMPTEQELINAVEEEKKNLELNKFYNFFVEKIFKIKFFLNLIYFNKHN